MNLCHVKHIVQWRMDNLLVALLAKKPLAFVVLAQGFEDGVKLAVDCSLKFLICARFLGEQRRKWAECLV